MSSKPNISKSVLSSILCLPIYTITYTLFALAFSLVTYLLFYLPLIGDLLTWLFHARGDSPDMVLALLAPSLSYVVVKASLEKIVKHIPSRGLGCKIFGVFMIVIQALSLLVNIFSSGGGYILSNIIQIIVGFCFFNLGRDYCDQSNS